jgi:hypothetical protein
MRENNIIKLDYPITKVDMDIIVRRLQERMKDDIERVIRTQGNDLRLLHLAVQSTKDFWGLAVKKVTGKPVQTERPGVTYSPLIQRLMAGPDYQDAA